MTEPFVVWAAKIEQDATTLVDLEGLYDPHTLPTGESRAEHWPDSVRLHMTPERPTDLALPDNVKNTANLVVVSPRLAEFLRARAAVGVEYLPVGIVDHKGRLLEERYVIVHPIAPFDCLDLERCAPRWSAIDRRYFTAVEQLALIEDAVPEARAIFRPVHYRGRPLVRAALAQEILEAGFTGVQFVPASSIRGRIR